MAFHSHLHNSFFNSLVNSTLRVRFFFPLCIDSVKVHPKFSLVPSLVSMLRQKEHWNSLINSLEGREFLQQIDGHCSLPLSLFQTTTIPDQLHQVVDLVLQHQKLTLLCMIILGPLSFCPENGLEPLLVFMAWFATAPLAIKKDSVLGVVQHSEAASTSLCCVQFALNNITFKVMLCVWTLLIWLAMIHHAKILFLLCLVSPPFLSKSKP